MSVRRPLAAGLLLALLAAPSHPATHAAVRSGARAAALAARARAVCAADTALLVRPLPIMSMGRPHTAESRAKISAANKGKVPWNTGRAHSPETIELIRARTAEAMRERAAARESWLAAHPDEAAQLAADTEARRQVRLQAQREQRTVARAALQEERAAEKTERAAERAAEAAAAPAPAESARAPRPPPTAEVRARIAATLRLRWQDETYRAGRNLPSPSNETRAKLSEAMRQRWREGGADGGGDGGGDGGRAHSAERKVRAVLRLRSEARARGAESIR
jgi:hypothetical protein